jgi:hypothetical protein
MSTSDAIREKTDTQTSLEPLLVALEHIEARGNLLLLSTDHAHRVQIMKAMTELELVEWNAVIKKYQLTSYGWHVLQDIEGP